MVEVRLESFAEYSCSFQGSLQRGSCRVDFVRSPDLSEDLRPVPRLVLGQQPGEPALRQHHRAQERGRVETEQLRRPPVDLVHALGRLERFVGVALLDEHRGRLADLAPAFPLQPASRLPLVVVCPELERDLAVRRLVVHDFLVGVAGERRLPVEHVGHRFEDRGFPRSRVAHDRDQVAVAEVDRRRCFGPEGPEPLDP